MLYLLITLLIIFIIINNKIFEKFINYPNIILILWISSSLISSLGLYGMYKPSNLTYFYILSFLIVFEIVSIFFKIKNINSTYSKYNIVENWKLMFIILIFCIIFLLPFAFKGIFIYLNDGSFSAIRNAYFQYEISGNKMQMFITLIIIPIGNAIGIYSILKYINYKKINASLILYLFFLLEIIFSSGGRSKVVFFVVITIIALFSYYKSNLKQIISNNRKILAFLIILLIIVALITFQRNLSGKGFLFNIYSYFVGSINLLGVYLAKPSRYLLDNNNLLYGQSLVSGFAYPFTFVLHFFNVDLKSGLYIINEVTQQFVAISPNTTINNNTTFLYFALRDFGYFGIILYSFVLSLIFAKLYYNKEQNNNLLNQALYCYYFQCFLFLLFDYDFSNSGVILTFIFLVLLVKKTKIPIDKNFLQMKKID